MQFRIRAFRATKDPEACDKFIAGHKQVLETVGVKQVTSSSDSWKYHKGTFAIIVESMDGQKVYGGARIQASDGIIPLPIEEATGYMDDNIYKMVAKTAQRGTGELCGLWNTREVAGYGVGAFFATRVGVVIAEQIGLNSIWALCAPYTVKFAERVGCVIVKDLGNNGTFYYPKIDLLATAVLMEDCIGMQTAVPYEIGRIKSLRKDLNQEVTEIVPERTNYVNIAYNLEITDASRDEFHLVGTL
jgi:hypothetical protein